jgi:hypothetical protein
MSRYSFVSEFDKDQTDPDQDITFYYQITCNEHPKIKKYQMRRFTINGNNEFINVEYFNLPKDQYERFLKFHKPKEYKCYSVLNIQDVNPPSLADIYILKSEMLAGDNNYYGSAPFIN